MFNIGMIGLGVASYMRIDADDGFIDFQFFDVELEHYPSIALSIEVSINAFFGSFTGYRQHVWFSLSDTENFIHELKVLDGSRQGEAKLLQMSDQSEWCPFRFKIFSVDNLGHIALTAELLNTSYIGNRGNLVANKLTVTFEIDPSLLPNMIVDFRELFMQREK